MHTSDGKGRREGECVTIPERPRRLKTVNENRDKNGLLFLLPSRCEGTQGQGKTGVQFNYNTRHNTSDKNGEKENPVKNVLSLQ